MCPEVCTISRSVLLAPLYGIACCEALLASVGCVALLAVPAAAGEDWEEVGEEVPFHTESAPGRSRRRGAAVPAGDYFTVVKGSPCLEMSNLGAQALYLLAQSALGLHFMFVWHASECAAHVLSEATVMQHVGGPALMISRLPGI